MRYYAALALVLTLAACSSTSPTATPATLGPTAPANSTACKAIVAMVATATAGHTISGSQVLHAFSAGERAPDPAVSTDSHRLETAVRASDGRAVESALLALARDCGHLGFAS